MSVSPGFRLGPYEILVAIGAGGMGEVWRAKDTRLDRDVAIKILPAEFAQNAQLHARFDREAKAISALSHPHICTLYDVGSITPINAASPISYLVMELLEGESLAERLRRGPLPTSEVLRYGQQIASALDAAHRKGITHRDIKPGNVMITRSGAKLLDFGLAHTGIPAGPISGLGDAPTAALPLTAEGTIVGTLQYMAPEQIEGLGADARTDIFALGALLYEMLSGRRAFEGTSKTSLIAAIVSVDPPPLSELIPMTPPALEHIVRKCLAKHPDDRWQSAADVAGQLQWISEIAASRSGEIEAARKREPKTRSMLPWLAALLLVLAGIGAGRYLGSASGTSSLQQVRGSIALPAGTQLAGWGSPAVAISPDGTMVAFVASRGGTQQLYLRRIDESEAKLVDGSDGAEGPFFSPDGQWVAFGAGAISGRSADPRALKKAAVGGGPAQTICSVDDYFGGSWSENGFIYFVGVDSDGLWRVAAAGGPPERLKRAPSQPHSTQWPQVLSGGEAALVTIIGNEKERQLALVDLATGVVEPLKVRADFGRVVGGTRLIFVRRDGALLAAPFSMTRRSVGGPAVPVFSDIALTANAAAVFAVSENGTAVYTQGYVRGSGRELRVPVRVDRTGKVTSLGFEPDTISFLRVSPDETRLAATTWAGDLFIYDLKRKTRMKITAGDSYSRSGPVWSPDGKTLVFAVQTATAMPMMMQPADGRDAPRMLLDLKRGEAWPGSFTPDGQWLAYYVIGTTPEQSRWEVWLMPIANPSAARKLTMGYAPRISPDGRWIAYESPESGRSEIYLQSFPSAGSKVVVSTAGGRSAAWSRDGKRLLYWQENDLMEVDVSGSPRLEVDIPSRVFDGRQFDVASARRASTVTPVDDGFIMLAPVAGSSTQTHLSFATGWLEEVDRKLRAAGK